MSVFRCERVSVGDVDRAIAKVGRATLVRTPAGTFVEVPPEKAAATVRALAFAGVRAVPVVVSFDPGPHVRPAIGRDLAPLPLGSCTVDLVHVRTIALASETRRLSRRRPWGSPRDRALCRELLHGDDATIAWRRRAWSTREVLRSHGVRRSLRPVIFDVGAIGSPPEHRALASAGDLGRWLFG